MIEKLKHRKISTDKEMTEMTARLLSKECQGFHWFESFLGIEKMKSFTPGKFTVSVGNYYCFSRASL